MTGRLRLPGAFVARALRFDEMPPTPLAGECHPFDYDRFTIVHNARAMQILADDLGLTEARIRAALAISFVDPQIVADADWAQLLAQVLDAGYMRSCNLGLPGSHGLRKILYPFLNLAQTHIDGLQTRFAGDWARLGEVLLRQFSDKLINLALKSVLLEANILSHLRPPAQAAAATDFADYFENHCVRSIFFVQKFYLRYAALSRLLAVATLHWRENIAELLHRLDADRTAIAAGIFSAPFGLISNVSGTLSDSHDGGKSVLFLEFDCGRRLVYKPRPLEIDVVFQRLTALVAAAGVKPELRCLRLVCGDGYGWVEHVQHQPLADLADAPAFFFRQGINLALVQLLRGTDFHSENIIAEGSQPLLVDLEALLHPRPNRGDDAPRLAPAEEWLGNTVFVSGLLPGWARGEDMREPDLSGLGAGQEVEYYQREAGVVRQDEQGNLRILSERVAVPQRENRLMFAGEPVRPRHYTKDIVAGFTAAYDVLLARRAELADERMVRADGVVRYIALDTSTYGHTLQQSLHPDFTRRSVHRELVAASLAYRAPFVDFTRLLLPAEISAVFEGDIPKFVARLDTTTISDGRETSLAGFLRETPLGIMRQRIAALSVTDRDGQAGIIRMAMATLSKPGEPGTEAQPRVAPAPEELPADDMLAQVTAIGDAICDQAVTARGVPDWVIISQGENGRSALLPAGLDIYDGAGGIGIFLYEAGTRLQNDRFLQLAHACGERLVAALGQERFATGGAFNGAASSARALFRLGRAFAEKSWCADACAELVQLRGLLEKDRMFDVIGGCAGYAAVALDLFRATGEAALRDAAIDAAEFLIGKRIACDIGHALPPRHGQRPLTGLSHGAAGIGLVLLQIGAEMGRADFVAAGYSAFDYEYSQFDPAINGYPDLREMLENDPPADSGAWCHGSPGIALSRIAMPLQLRRKQDQTCIAEGLARILGSQLAPNDCLCHGEIGNSEILVAAAQVDGNPALAVAARQRMSTALSRQRQQRSWRCGTVARVFVPGAMVGMAGIGLGLLRAWNPDGVRSILVPC